MSHPIKAIPFGTNFEHLEKELDWLKARCARIAAQGRLAEVEQEEADLDPAMGRWIVTSLRLPPAPSQRCPVGLVGRALAACPGTEGNSSKPLNPAEAHGNRTRPGRCSRPTLVLKTRRPTGTVALPERMIPDFSCSRGTRCYTRSALGVGFPGTSGRK